VKAGALGAINAFTENPALRNGRQWINAWGDDGWAFTKQSAPLLSFSITPKQTDLLRKLLARGPVRVRATVDSRYYSGGYPYVTAVIPGTGPEEVLTLGHAFEQGAEDNATGVAATMEALATLNRLIESGALPRPKRSIRILSMAEMYGSMHYVANNPERIRRTVAAMCVDTPAALYKLAGTEYTFYMNPHVAKDFTDALILKIAADYFPRVHRPWHERPFTTGTDTYLAEPMVGVPTVWGYSGSGVETHHNSEDTPDRVDPRSLRDITIVDAAFLYFVANAGEPEALWLARLSESRGYEQILKETQPYLDARKYTGELVAQAEDAIAYSVDRESQSVMSVLRLVPRERRTEAQDAIEPMIERLRKFGELQLARVRAASGGIKAVREPGPREAEAEKIVVKRKRFGTIPLDDLPHDQWEGQPSGAWAAIPTIALYWCDGHRTLAEVARLTRLELGPTDFDFVSYFRFLRKHGYVDFTRGS
ncbi:MAG: M28 family peptidase, partial [Bryobacteraceae bacterium]